MGVEAADRIAVKTSKRRRIERERAFRTVSCSVKKGIDEGRDICAQVFEDEKAARNISDQEGTAVLPGGRAGREIGGRNPFPGKPRNLEQALSGWIVSGRAGRLHHDRTNVGTVGMGDGARNEVPSVWIAQRVQRAELDHAAGRL
jgi:hypothetical protein